MSTRKISIATVFGVICLLALAPSVTTAETTDDTLIDPTTQPVEVQDVAVTSRNMGGPRFGLTYVMGDGQLAEELEFHDMGRSISQFGWHFEKQVVPAGGGPAFVIEFIPLLAGVEYGKVIPNFSLLMGMRSPSGWELGMGPNLSFSKTIEDAVEARTSLILAMGKSFRYGGVSIPVNLAYSASPEGNRVSVFFGYAIASAKK
ncbi:MAG: hypothetical protein ACI9UK_001500 [Candidatus Krumholzibacteriia bacterium]|jgi:hypothetical protein